MKRKYLIIVISIIAAIAVGIISFPFLVKLKLNYEYSVAEAKRNKAFKEMIAFCEENQKEIEIYSNRYISLKSPDMSYKELEKLEKQIAKELDCTELFENIAVRYTGEWEKKEGNILYRYKTDEYVDFENGIIEVLYINEEMSEQEIKEMYFFEPPAILYDIKKINAHLYVFVRGYMCL